MVSLSERVDLVHEIHRNGEILKKEKKINKGKSVHQNKVINKKKNCMRLRAFVKSTRLFFLFCLIHTGERLIRLSHN